MNRPLGSRFPSIVIAVGVILIAGVLLFARAMDRDLNHDEHQFLAPGALMLRQGAQPYCDYPLFHLPNLVFIYAGVAAISDYYILSAKMLSLIGSIGVLVLLASRALRTAGPAWWGGGLFACGAVLLLCDPVFLRTAGKTWNHELPGFFALAAFVAQVAAIEKKSLAWATLAGFAMSAAIGMRLTFLPIALPLAASCLMVHASVRSRIAMIASFAAGGVVAGLPTLHYLATCPEAFWFGNLEFPRVRLLDLADTRARETASWWRKLRYFFKEIVRPGWPLFLAFAIVGVRPGWKFLQQKFSGVGEQGDGSLSAALALMIVPFAALGCALPTRYQSQHWFALVPLVVLATVEGAACLSNPRHRKSGLTLLGIISIISCARGASEYKPIANLFLPAEWFAIKAHRFAEELSARVGPGKMLTLAPAWPAEGKIPTYPEFASGPFAWRLAHLLPPEQRQQFHVVSPADLEAFLAKEPPAAILTGVEDDDLEAPLEAYARAHGFIPGKLRKGRVLWLPPGARR